ncbi:MFS transporter [Xylanimonas ulmi]|uniref:Oligogalacturonide transporter n=1 Tax=Xylanimonas ulmi TaxID=228973 RepID=A0A4Q7M026_9MICO|nr:MFS transporter [Xylanibacterium ulmi]RZS59892.1 oligogalacturonide transporter [Xylanibacterium ulmi]
MATSDTTRARVYTARPITLARSVGFGVLDFMGGGWNTIVGGLMLYFFTTYGGVSVGQSATILFVARIVDALASLLIGPATDNFYRTRLGRRFGRRHFFLLVGVPALLVVFPLLWVSGGGFWYYLVVYLAVEVVMAFILIPWETLPTEMTDDYAQRTKLSSTRMFLSALGTFVVFFVPAMVKETGNPHAFTITGAIFAVLFGAAVATTYLTTWERELTPELIAELDARPRLTAREAVVSTAKDFASTFRNASFRKHLTIYLFSFTGKDVYASALTFFTVYAVTIADGEQIGFVLQTLSIVGLPVTVAAGFLMVKRGPRFLWATSYTLILLALVATGAIYALRPGAVVALLVVVNVVYQAGRALLEFTPWNVFPFIPDVDRIMTGKDRAGIYAAVMTFGRKSTGALATLLVGWLLEVGGFVSPGADGAPVAQTPQALHTVALVTVLAPAALILVAFVTSRLFRLDATTHAVLRAEIDRLAAGGAKADATPRARAVAEQLTGRPYDELWPVPPVAEARALV